jgi:TonB-dependent receptor
MFSIRRGWNACTIGRLLISLLLLALPAFAQADRGVISGSIMDKSGAVLKGARIELLPSGITASANSQGDFVMRDVAPGHYTLTASYIGFKAQNEEIDVTANGRINLALKLDVASRGEEIVVSDTRGFGEAETINQTRTADNIIDVLPADIITSLPNANIADALGRLPGVVLERAEGEGEYVDIRGLEPRLTNITIDGITVPSPEPTVRQVRLDVINSDLVEAVEINKTLSANQDGDGIAGSVNLRTKMATDQPLFSVYGNGGYSRTLGGREADQFGGVWGQRFGQAKKLGILIGGTYDYNGRGIDNIQPAIDPLSTMAQPFYDSNTIREYRYYRTRDGLSGSADYKLNDNNNFYFHGLFSDLKDWGDKWYYSPQSNPLIAPGVIAPGADVNAPKFYTSSKRPNASIGSLSLGGRHVRQNSWFTWEVAAARSYEVDSAGNPKADFSWVPKGIPNCNYNPLTQTNVNTPTFGACDQANSPLLNATSWTLKDLTTSKGLSSDLNLSAATSYARNYYVNGHFSTFEAGFKIRNGHKDQDATETVYDKFAKGNSSLLMSSLQGTFDNHSYYHGNYFGGQYGPVSDFNQVQSYVQGNLGGDVDGAKTAADTLPNIFHTVERITAGYAMNTIDFGKLHVQTGVRFEGTQMDTFGYTVALFPGSGNVPGIGSCAGYANGTGCGVGTPAVNNPDYLDVLPSVQLRYGLSHDSVLRAVYSRGVARPDPYQLVPYAIEDQTASPTALTIGNPSLKPEHANNYDLLYERYLHPLGMFQAGGFFKQLTAPEVLLTGVPATLVPASMQPVVQSYNGTGDAITMYVNGQNAYVYGFETAYQQHWTQLPGVLRGLGMSGNYTFTASQIKGITGLRTDHPALQRQTPNSWNLGPTYDTKHISMRVGLQYSGASIYTYGWNPGNDKSGLGPTGPSGDVYTYPHMQVDAQGTFKLGSGFTAMVYGLNLTNEVFGFYTGSTQFVNQREYYKQTYGGGLRYTFGQER